MNSWDEIDLHADYADSVRGTADRGTDFNCYASAQICYIRLIF